jgi:hypothetical protein
MTTTHFDSEYMTAAPAKDSQTLINESSSLSLDVWGRVLEFVPAHDLLKNVSRAALPFANILRDDCFWKAYTENVTNNDRNWKCYQSYDGFLNNILRLQQICVYATAKQKIGKFSQGYCDDPAYRCFVSQSLLPTMAQAAQARYPPADDTHWMCLASTTHHALREAIECTLSPASRTPWNGRPVMPGWWSSQPTPTWNTQETLLYVTSSHCAYLHKLSINPLVDLFRGRVQVYGWRQTQITAYLVTTSHREKCCSMPTLLNDMQKIKAFVQNQSPVYQSPLLPTKARPVPLRLDSDAWEHYEFPRGIVANAFTITLHGKKSREMMGYYACIEQVELEGIPFCDNGNEIAK